MLEHLQPRNQTHRWQRLVYQVRPSNTTTTTTTFRPLRMNQRSFQARFIIAKMLLISFFITVSSATSSSSSSSSSSTTTAFISTVTSLKAVNIPSMKWNEMKYHPQVLKNDVISRPLTFTAFQQQQQCRSFDDNPNRLQLFLGKNSNSNIDVDGMQTAPYIFTFILLLCVWNFTIPTEFRRARICSEQQVIEYPDSNCKTWSQYASGIQDYYRNGGTLFKFDFSIDRENNIWITGPQEIIE